MQIAVQHLVLVQPDPLAAVCFALGIAGLMFAFRHTIFKGRRRSGNVLPEMEARFNGAHQRIEKIDERELYNKQQQGVRFQRTGQPLTSTELNELDQLSEKLPKGVRRNG